jgi:hypothetical protein
MLLVGLWPSLHQELPKNRLSLHLDLVTEGEGFPSMMCGGRKLCKSCDLITDNADSVGLAGHFVEGLVKK